MKLLTFLHRKRCANDPITQNAYDITPYERLIRRTEAAEDALELIGQTQQRGYRFEPCQFDAKKFDPAGICFDCPGHHACAQQSARYETAIQAMITALVDACYALLYDVGVALDNREKETQLLFARLYVDIGLFTEDAEQKETLTNAAEIYKRLLKMTGDSKYNDCIRACARIIAGDRAEALEFFRQNGEFGAYKSELGK